jgi:hypothetical protein
VGPGFERQDYRKRRLAARFEALGFLKDEQLDVFLPRQSKNAKKHPSLLIRAIAPSGSGAYFYHDFGDVFLEMFLRCRVAAKNTADLYRRRFRESLMREIRLDEEHDEAG